MDVTLPADLADFVNKKVNDGLFSQASDVVSEALREFRERDLASSLGGTSKIPWWTLDVEALVSTVMMEAAKSANQDLKDIMAKIKSVTAAKQQLRHLISKISRDVAKKCRTDGWSSITRLLYWYGKRRGLSPRTNTISRSCIG